MELVLRLEQCPYSLYGGGFHRGLTKESQFNVVVRRTKIEMSLRCLVGGSGIPLERSYYSGRNVGSRNGETEHHIASWNDSGTAGIGTLKLVLEPRMGRRCRIKNYLLLAVGNLTAS